MGLFWKSAFTAAVFAAAVATGLSQVVKAQGSVFTAADVDESQFVMVAAPIGKGESSQLNIYEQRTSARPCFEVSGASPAVVDPCWRVLTSQESAIATSMAMVIPCVLEVTTWEHVTDCQ